MRATRALGMLLTAVMVSLLLSGCLPGRSVETKTLSIANELKGMPGILEIEPSFNELSLGKSRYSAIWVTLAEEATETEVVDILTAFTTANRATGIEKVSTKLKFVVDTDDPLVSERLALEYAEAEARQLSDLARAWFELRTRYGGADVSLVRSTYREHPMGFEVTIGMPEGSTAADDLATIRDVSTLFADIGPVIKLYEVEGRFTVSRDLPSEATIALAESVAATEGVTDLRGQFFGEEMLDLDARMSEESGLVDFAIGVSPVMARVVDLVPQDAVPLRLSFLLGDARERAAFFYNESCEASRDLLGSTASRGLLQYWARDGRTLLDGATAASCFN